LQVDLAGSSNTSNTSTTNRSNTVSIIPSVYWRPTTSH
jgi:hypothetical protein